MDRPKIQTLWTPYLELLIKDLDDYPSKIVRESLERLMRHLDNGGVLDLFVGVVLPLLEAKVVKVSLSPPPPTIDETEGVILWAMKALVMLNGLSSNLISRLLESRARYLTLVEGLLFASTSTVASFQTEIGYAAYRCLEALALAEEMYFYDAGEKVGDPYFHL